ncbi:MAG: hypothetical protein ACYTEX_22960 [Planctomycetota bacterium]
MPRRLEAARHDLRIRAQFENFGIHNCAWIVDPYIDSYASIPRLGYIDMGITSDLEKAKGLFPETQGPYSIPRWI